jgi:hypothetical protein
MKLSDKYALGELLSDGEVKTYAAREASSGSSVLVHRLSSGAGQAELMRKVLRYLRSTPPGASSQILEMVEDEGVIHLVTRPIPGFKTLKDWLNALGPEAKPPIGPRIDPKPPVIAPSNTIIGTGTAGLTSSQDETLPAGPTGEFTQLFGRPPSSAPREPVKPPPGHAPEPSSVAPPPRTDETVFLTPAPPAPTGAGEGIGEFTALFRSSGPAAATEVEKSGAPPGEFTQIFQSSPLAAPPATDSLGSRPAPTSQPKSNEAKPGEFTMLFRHPLEEPPASEGGASPFSLAREAEPQRPGELTQILQSAGRSEPLDAPQPAKPESELPGSAFPSSSASGDFTSIFGSRAEGSAPAPEWKPAGDLSSTIIASPRPPLAVQPTPVAAPAIGSKPDLEASRAAPPVPQGGALGVKGPASIQSPPAVPSSQRPEGPSTFRPSPPKPPVKVPPAVPVSPVVKPPAIPSPAAVKPAPPGPGSASSWLPIALILGGLGLAVVAIVLYLTMK